MTSKGHYYITNKVELLSQMNFGQEQYPTYWGTSGLSWNDIAFMSRFNSGDRIYDLLGCTSYFQ